MNHLRGYQGVSQIFSAVKSLATHPGQVVLDGVLSTKLTLEVSLVGQRLLGGHLLSRMCDQDFTGCLQPKVLVKRGLSDPRSIHAVVNNGLFLFDDNSSDMCVFACRKDPDRQAVALAEDERTRLKVLP